MTRCSRPSRSRRPRRKACALASVALALLGCSTDHGPQRGVEAASGGATAATASAAPASPSPPSASPSASTGASAEGASIEGRPAAPVSIGVATMEADGTIVLMLRAEGPGAARGDARITYPRGHKEYDSVLQHLGGLKPGESKPVPPWPD